MENKYDDETLKQINDSVDLLSYARKSLVLEQKGNDFFAHCPMHTDKTPSLSFTPAKNAYYCFSCGCSGGIIGFLMDFENLEFNEAVEKAASLANVDLSKICQSKTISFLKKIRGLYHKEKIPYKHEIIKQSDYEKFSPELPKEWIDEGIDEDVMRLFGVRSDVYGNRIVYPVYDINGNLINIKGRTTLPNFKELRIAKYINYYSVGVMDYFQGLNITLPFIKEKNEVIIFESIKSVMKAYAWGYKNCASAEKHTLTPEQVDLLVKLKVNIVFAYDSDVNYRNSEVAQSINKLKRVTNVYLIEDKEKLLGGVDAKNSPADCGLDIFEELYFSKRKVV